MQERAARNEAAFRSSLDDRLTDVYAFFRRLRVDHATAQDLVQETFVTAWQDLADLRDARALRPWLYRIAYRRYLRYHVNRRETARLPEDLPAPPEEAPGSDARLARQAVSQALRALPEAYLHPLLLLHWEGLSYPEAARVLSLPLGTFAWRVHKAVRLLRAALAEGERDDETMATPRPEPTDSVRER